MLAGTFTFWWPGRNASVCAGAYQAGFQPCSTACAARHTVAYELAAHVRAVARRPFRPLHARIEAVPVSIQPLPCGIHLELITVLHSGHTLQHYRHTDKAQ